MKTIFIFDVDGTLTPAGQPINAGFEPFFRAFVLKNTVYLVSGSDYSKIHKQLPRDILNACSGIFGCSGAEYFEQDREIFSKKHKFSDELKVACQTFIDQSEYPIRTGTHIEERTGMLNVSTVGRQADKGQRQHYFKWDQTRREREKFAAVITTSNLPYEASTGGQISVDIAPVGWNKSVAANEILLRHHGARLIFFGDRICKGGNDKPLADALTKMGSPHRAIHVKDYHDTRRHLESGPEC